MGKKKQWFISYGSTSPANAPAFFNAIKALSMRRSDIELLLPHAEPGKVEHRFEELKSADLVVAEISAASTGSGIELGWAHAEGKPIIAFHLSTSSISPAVPLVASAIHSYLSAEDILAALDAV